MKISVDTRINAPIETVWHCWTTPEHIMAWNAASDDWHTTASEVDLRQGGTFKSRMEAKDGSFGFDFEGTYTTIDKPHRIEAMLGDRALDVTFREDGDAVEVTETFDAEDEHSEEMQRAGWQAILDNFKRHVEAEAAK